MDQISAPAAFSSDTNDHRPIIGISGSGAASKSVAAIMTQIRSAGAEPVFISDPAMRIQKYRDVTKAVAHDLSHIDALIVMGNDDNIDPRKYGERPEPGIKVETDLARASYEETAIRQALDKGVPLLGICCGMQRMNVLGGGTLHQDVSAIVGDNHHHWQSEAPFLPVQAVIIVAGTKLEEIAKGIKSIHMPPGYRPSRDRVVLENSFRRQAAKVVRADFRVNAVSNDGVIEGIEPKPGSRYANQYVMGVQFHPEFGASDLGARIAASITSAAKAFALRKPQKAVEQEDAMAFPGEGMVEWLLRRRRDSILLAR